MPAVEKQLVINADVFESFVYLLENMIENKKGEHKIILKKIYDSIFFSTSVKEILQAVKKMEKEPEVDHEMLGVIYFFLARVFAKRKNFALALNLLEKSEKHFLPTHADFAFLVKKEMYILKMAYHYEEN